MLEVKIGTHPIALPIVFSTDVDEKCWYLVYCPSTSILVDRMITDGGDTDVGRAVVSSFSFSFVFVSSVDCFTETQFAM